jgi:NDP-sugar pyrophosphorylase family protein
VKGVKAVVLAGGQRTWLPPPSTGRPKPIVPVGNQPILIRLLDLLRRSGITQVVITLQFMPGPDRLLVGIYAQSSTAHQGQGLADKYARIVEAFQG